MTCLVDEFLAQNHDFDNDDDSSGREESVRTDGIQNILLSTWNGFIHSSSQSDKSHQKVNDF